MLGGIYLITEIILLLLDMLIPDSVSVFLGKIFEFIGNTIVIIIIIIVIAVVIYEIKNKKEE